VTRAEEFEQLRALLAADVQMVGDGGGKAPQWARGIIGAENVACLEALYGGEPEIPPAVLDLAPKRSTGYATSLREVDFRSSEANLVPYETGSKSLAFIFSRGALDTYAR
jgi:hypothetical protein